MDRNLHSLDHVGITVTSLSRSLEFYRDLLGLKELSGWSPKAPYLDALVGYPDVELHVAFLELPRSRSRLELLEYRNIRGETIDTRNGNPGTAHIAFLVEDVDGLFERLARANVRYVSRPVTPSIGANAGGRAVYMIDPDGVRVELFCPAPGERQPNN